MEERRERGQRAEDEEGERKPHSWSVQPVFNVYVCAVKALHNEQNGYFWLATLRRSLGGNALDGNLNTMNRSVVAPHDQQIPTNKHSIHSIYTILRFRSQTAPQQYQSTVVVESIPKLLELWNLI
jgi:hypothetical protein